MNASTFSSTTASPASAARQPLSRNALIALVVVALHVVFIWVLQNGLLMHSTELVVPAEVLSQFIDTPAPRVEPAPPVPPTPAVQKKTASKAPAQRLQPQARHLAIADTTPSLDAPTGVVTPPLAPDPVAEAPAAAPADQVVMQLPSSNAGYLQNPTPPYPPLSARLGETGRVVYKVWRGAGFPRLDKAAYETVMRWRYVPGKRNGVPETMPFNVPISWELRN
jgi:protein TonB